MSRSNYSDDNTPQALVLWRQAVNRAVHGKRGQDFLREFIDALDEMPVRKLCAGSFATPEGEFCALGVLGAKRGIDMEYLADGDYCDTELVGQRFGIARAMAAEIMDMNDASFVCSDNERWLLMRLWADGNLYQTK